MLCLMSRLLFLCLYAQDLKSHPQRSSTMAFKPQTVYRHLPNGLQKKSWKTVARTEFVMQDSNNSLLGKFTLDIEWASLINICKILLLLGSMSVFCLWSTRYILQKGNAGAKLFIFLRYVLILPFIGSETQYKEVPLLTGTSCGSKVLTAAPVWQH